MKTINKKPMQKAVLLFSNNETVDKQIDDLYLTCRQRGWEITAIFHNPDDLVNGLGDQIICAHSMSAFNPIPECQVGRVTSLAKRSKLYIHKEQFDNTTDVGRSGVTNWLCPK